MNVDAPVCAGPTSRFVPEFIRKACIRMLVVRDRTLTADIPVEPDTFGDVLNHLTGGTAQHGE